MSAREEILARIRAALADRPRRPTPPARLPADGRAGRGAVARRSSSSGCATTRRRSSSPTTPGSAAAAAFAAAGARGSGSPRDLDPALRARRARARRGRRPRRRSELDALDGALTTCAAGCAETGTIALDGGPGQGRRALSLVPDLHVCIVRAEADRGDGAGADRSARAERAREGGRSCSSRARRRRATSS